MAESSSSSSTSSKQDGSTSEEGRRENKNEQKEEEEKVGDVRVVLEQTLLKCDEVFVYRIPPMMTSGGHRAEDWNLAKPLATCSLEVLRRDNDLYIKLMADRPKEGAPKGATEPHLFAQCIVRLNVNSNGTNKQQHNLRMEHWVETVVDSSRYFAIRISDERTGREAHVGMGFRERTDATNFKMSLQDYENALRRESKAEAMHVAYEQQQQQEEYDGTKPGEETSRSGVTGGLPPMSKLTLKEGEKIHIKLKGSRANNNSSYKSPIRTKLGTGKGGLFVLKKPPPPASSAAAAAALKNAEEDGDAHDDDDDDIPGIARRGSVMDEPGPAVVITGGVVIGGGSLRGSTASVASASDIGSTGAVGDLDEDDWGDFESGT